MPCSIVLYKYFEAVEGGFVVLMGWSVGVGYEERENWGDVGAGACC